MKRSAWRFGLALIIGALALGTLPRVASAQWTIDYTVRYEAAGQQTGKPGEARGPDTLVSEKRTWRVQQEARGVLAYTQKVRGAVASNMPDKNNEQRYDSWLHRPGSGGKPSRLKMDGEEIVDSAARLGKADGEGATEVNRQRAGKVGRVEHQRTRVAIAADGDTAARLAGAFLQIDRVDGKLHFEPPAVDIDPAQVRYTVQKVTRMDKPAAAGEWDSTDSTDGEQRTRALRLSLLPVQVFDMPRDADSLDATRTIDVPGRIGGKATITIALRRAGAASAGAAAGASAGSAPVSASSNTATTTAAAPAAAASGAARTKPNCPPSTNTAAAGVTPGATAGAAAGAEVGGKALGGGHGRQVGSAIGGFLGALSGAAKKEEPATPQDCPN